MLQSENKLNLSIIICTYKRYDLTINCLKYLTKQNCERKNFEILVIDNTPPQFRESIDWTSHGVDGVYIEEISGLSRARNRGIREAKNNIIAFIDDDAEAIEGWCKDLLNVFEKNPEALVVGGRVEAKYPIARPLWLSTKLEGYLSCIDWGKETKAIEAGQWIVGANMAFRKEVFAKYGIFDEGLGRVGHSNLMGNEEIKLISLLPKNSVFYSYEPLVYHLIPEDRMKQVWFRKRAYWQAISDLLAGLVPPDSSKYFFEQFSSKLVPVKAEYRSFKAFNHYCDTSDEIENQLSLVYNYAIANGMGLEDIK